MHGANPTLEFKRRDWPMWTLYMYAMYASIRPIAKEAIM